MKKSTLRKDNKIEDNIIKDKRNIFRLKKIHDTTMKDIRNLLRLIDSHLTMVDVTDAGYTHRKRVCKDFKIKKNSRIS